MHNQLSILELVEQGRIGVDEAVRRLKALDSDGSAGPEGPVMPTGIDPPMPGHAAFRRGVPERVSAIVWQATFGAGVAVLAGGGFLLGRFYSGAADRGLGWGWLLFAIGVLSTMLGWWLRRARWLAIRLRNRDGEEVHLALPVPLGLAAWVLQVGGHFVPHLEQGEAEALAMAIRTEFGDDGVFSVMVNEDEGGDDLELTIG